MYYFKHYLPTPSPHSTAAQLQNKIIRIKKFKTFYFIKIILYLSRKQKKHITVKENNFDTVEKLVSRRYLQIYVFFFVQKKNYFYQMSNQDFNYCMNIFLSTNWDVVEFMVYFISYFI